MPHPAEPSSLDAGPAVADVAATMARVRAEVARLMNATVAMRGTAGRAAPRRLLMDEVGSIFVELGALADDEEPALREAIGKVVAATGRQRLAAAFAEGVNDVWASGDIDEAVIDSARDAGRRFAAGRRWAEVTGDRIDTATARKLLDITRQALHRRIQAGTLIAVPGTSTSWFPTWQFTTGSKEELQVRPVVARIVQAFRDLLGDDLSPFDLISWADTPQPELDGVAPREWVKDGGDDEPVVLAAERAAAALAQ